MKKTRIAVATLSVIAAIAAVFAISEPQKSDVAEGASNAVEIDAAIATLTSAMSPSAYAHMQYTTQADFDKAIQCCWNWNSSVNAYCSTPDICRKNPNGVCRSPHFSSDAKSAGEMACSEMQQ